MVSPQTFNSNFLYFLIVDELIRLAVRFVNFLCLDLSFCSHYKFFDENLDDG